MKHMQPRPYRFFEVTKASHILETYASSWHYRQKPNIIYGSACSSLAEICQELFIFMQGDIPIL
ncbi:hypothetical protein AGMMS49936_00510 [Endomicrobiia bacterium]|nr:hypothetical protein AGMMS49936_00510 [Endomicrobiia bacterium]